MSNTSSSHSSSTARRLAEGDQAPDFTLMGHEGMEVQLTEYIDNDVLVYFYPKANTPGCTKEACDFRDNLAELNKLGIQVLGISPDTPEQLRKFADEHGLGFPLLSDPDKKVMQQWGAFGEKKNYGKVVQGVIRSTFLVHKGTIVLAKYNVRATGHVQRVMREIGE